MAVIKRIGVLKMSGFLALYSFFIGLILAIILGLLSAMLSGLLGSTGFSILTIILFPFIYGIGTFVISLIIIPIMNLVLKITKGINLDMELAGQAY